MNGLLKFSEEVSRTAALGIRFVDTLSQSFVADGLSVSAYPVGEPRLRRKSVVTPSGVHAFHDLPGLREFENAVRTSAPSWSAPRVPFRVEVVDELRRFLPFAFDAALPHIGLFQLDCTGSVGSFSGFSSPGGPPGIPLYSAPARRPDTVFGCVRAELWDPVKKAAAAWALVELHTDTEPVFRGVADDKGRLVIFLPYPEPADLPGTASSAFPSSPPVAEQGWPVKLTAFYSPGAQSSPGFDLCSTLAQSVAKLWADSAKSAELGDKTLQFGRELVLRTEGAERSQLWVTSA